MLESDYVRFENGVEYSGVPVIGINIIQTIPLSLVQLKLIWVRQGLLLGANHGTLSLVHCQGESPRALLGERPPLIWRFPMG